MMSAQCWSRSPHQSERQLASMALRWSTTWGWVLLLKKRLPCMRTWIACARTHVACAMSAMRKPVELAPSRMLGNRKIWARLLRWAFMHQCCILHVGRNAGCRWEAGWHLLMGLECASSPTTGWGDWAFAPGILCWDVVVLVALWRGCLASSALTCILASIIRWTMSRRSSKARKWVRWAPYSRRMTRALVVAATWQSQADGTLLTRNRPLRKPPSRSSHPAFILWKGTDNIRIPGLILLRFDYAMGAQCFSLFSPMVYHSLMLLVKFVVRCGLTQIMSHCLLPSVVLRTLWLGVWQGCLAAFFAREVVTWECPAESAAATKRRSEEQALASASLDGTPQPLKRRRCPAAHHSSLGLCISVFCGLHKDWIRTASPYWLPHYLQPCTVFTVLTAWKQCRWLQDDLPLEAVIVISKLSASCVFKFCSFSIFLPDLLY